MSVSGMAFGFPRFFLRLFRFFLRLFRFSSADSQRPSGAGRATIGRGSRDPRAQVAGNLSERNDFRADAFHCNRDRFA